MTKPTYSVCSKIHRSHPHLQQSLPHDDHIKWRMMSIILAFCASIGTIPPVNAEVVDELVAVVNGDAITLSMVQDATNAFWDDTDKRPRSKSEALEKLIDHVLELQEARRFVLMGAVSEKDLAREVAKLNARFPSQKEFDEVLKRRGITQADLEGYLVEEIMVNEMVSRKFRNFVAASDLDASEYYQQYKEELMIPETIYFDQIFFPLDPNDNEEMINMLKSQAQKIFEEIKNGVDFSKYTADSQDKSYIALKSGYISVDRVPIPVVASAVSQLEVGESKFIETPAGYFIIRLNERRPPRQASFDEAKEEIKNRIIQQKTQDELKAWLKKQRETADIRIKTVINSQQ